MTTLGILTMTHGIPARDNPRAHPGNAAVIEHIAAMNLPLPTAHGFMTLPGQLQPAVDELNAHGVDLIVGVFLYPATVNREITGPRAVLGFADWPYPDKPFVPIQTNARIILSKPKQAHPLLVDVLQEHLLAVAVNPAEEIALVVMHGDDIHPYRQLQERAMSALMRLLAMRGVFAETAWATFFPQPGNVAEVARRLHEQSGRRLVVSHMFTESSFYTSEKIPHALEEGVPSGACGYNPATMLESPTMRTYILARVAEALRLHGEADLIPEEARDLACAHPLCRLNADVRVSPDEKPLVCLDLPCAWPR